MTENQPSILIVDDNPLIVNVLTSLLTSQKCQVYSAANGKEGIKTLEGNVVDVIVCDVMMPEMDGYEFHKYVRSKQELVHIPFIFLTALGDNEELTLGRESGADDYVVKPFNPQELVSIIKGKVVRSRKMKLLSEARYESFRKRVVQTLSHEFRTPLVAINTGAELLMSQQKSGSCPPERIEKLLGAIQNGGQRLEKLVTDFMLLQQIEAGVAERLFKSQATTCYVKDIMEDIELKLRDSVLDAGFSYKSTTYNPNVKLFAMETQLLDIMGRLTENALKFSNEVKEVEIVSYTRDSDAIFEVRDRGIGIDPERIKEALDVFGQLDRDEYEQQGGGMGLPIAHLYAKIHHGSLEFKQRDGGGSIVSLVIPIMQ